MEGSMTRVRCFRLIPILFLALVLFSGDAIAAELITLTPSSTIITKGPVSFTIAPQALVPPTATPAAFASVVLLTGGDGVLGLDAQGRITQQGGNFLIRSAYRFLNVGMNVAILNARSSLTNAARLYDSHAMYVASAVAVARKRWAKTGGSVWLVGTSNGTISAFNLAALTASNAPAPLIAYPDRPDGVVLTSPIVQGGGSTVLTTTPLYNIARLTIPVAVVSHSADPCTASDSTLSQQFETGLMSPRKNFFPVTGALPAAAELGCDAFSYHGFHGVEDAVVQIIAAFIHQ
jgi:hypothetical protein